MSAWFQVIEAFRPKSEDLDQSFADLLASPYIRYRHNLSKESAQAIAARVALYKAASPELAAKLFMNSFLMHEIEGEADPDAKVEKIDSAIVEAAKEAQREAEAAAAQADAARKRARAVEEDAEKQMSALQAERDKALADERERKERALADERERKERALADERERSQRQISAKDANLMGRDEELRTLRHRIRLALFIGVGVALFAGGAFLVGVDAAWAYLGGAAVVASIIAAADQLISRKSHNTNDEREPPE